MQTIQFVDLVARMRTAQKEYFRTRSKEALVESKRLERSVDMYINAKLQDPDGKANTCQCPEPPMIQFDGTGICDECRKPIF